MSDEYEDDMGIATFRVYVEDDNPDADPDDPKFIEEQAFDEQEAMSGASKRGYSPIFAEFCDEDIETRK
jgi:hypothetical protein